MANENDNIKPEGVENPEHPQHHTWKDIISEEFQKINTEFPLSGGETEEDFARADDTEEGEEASGGKTATPPAAATQPGAEAPAGAPHEHHSMFQNLIHDIQNLDHEFPLSGGETEEDFEGADDEEEEAENEKDKEQEK